MAGKPTYVLFLFFQLLLSVNSVAQTRDVFRPELIKKSMMNTTFWQLNHPKHKANEWYNGAFYTGVFEADEVTESKNNNKPLAQQRQVSNFKGDNGFDESKKRVLSALPVKNGLILDLNADEGVTIVGGNRVLKS